MTARPACSCLRRWAGALATAALLGSALAPATAAAPPPTDLRVPVLVQEAGVWTIHDGDTVVPLPESITDNSGTSLPGSGEFDLVAADSATSYLVSEFTRELDEDGYLAVDGRTRFELHRVTLDGTVTTFHTADGEADHAWARANHNGRKVFVSTPIDDMPFARVVALDGTVTEMPARFAAEGILDFVGAKVLHGQTVRTKKFTGEQLEVRNLDRSTSRQVVRKAGATFVVGSLSGGVVGWLEPRGNDKPVRTSFATLSKPNAVLWTKKFYALALNPSAKRVIGWGAKGRLQVRRTSDGTVVQKLPKSLATESVLWTSNDDVLLAAGGTVVRCVVRGGCGEMLRVDGTVDLPGVLVLD